MSNLLNQANKYGNLISGIYSMTLPKPDAQVGDEATILSGRDRHPAKVVEIIRNKSGKITGYMLQNYHWTVDFNTEGYAKEIHWDQPQGAPRLATVVTRGKLKGTVNGAFIGRAQAFYDRSF